MISENRNQNKTETTVQSMSENELEKYTWVQKGYCSFLLELRCMSLYKISSDKTVFKFFIQWSDFSEHAQLSILGDTFLYSVA